MGIISGIYFISWPVIQLGFIYCLVRCIKEAVNGSDKKEFRKWLILTWVCFMFIASPSLELYY